MEDFKVEPMIVRSLMDDETEFIPLLTSDEDENISAFQIPNELPLLPLKNTVLFPGVVIPITVGRDKSIKLVQDAYRKDKIIAVVSQKDNQQEEPLFDDLNKIGSVGVILKVLRMPDGNTTVIIQGKKRIEITGLVKDEPYMVGIVKGVLETKPKENNKNFNATVSSLKDLSLQIINQSPQIPFDYSKGPANPNNSYTSANNNFAPHGAYYPPHNPSHSKNWPQKVSPISTKIEDSYVYPHSEVQNDLKRRMSVESLDQTIPSIDIMAYINQI